MCKYQIAIKHKNTIKQPIVVLVRNKYICWAYIMYVQLQLATIDRVNFIGSKLAVTKPLMSSKFKNLVANVIYHLSDIGSHN